jgi:hypothetical protein
MITQKIYSIPHCELTDPKVLSKNGWLVILHASRIPPHVGLMINGSYNSLTIKGRELNVSQEALLKTISQKKIEALFIGLKKHPVFSAEHQLNIFQHQLQQFTAVKQGEATCLSPIKLFFEEFYAIKRDESTLLFDFIETLEKNHFIRETLSSNIGDLKEKNIFTFNSYTSEELLERIKQERKAFNKD